MRSQGNRLVFVACGTIATSAAETLALRLKALHDGLSEVLGIHVPDAAAVEETFVNANPRAAVRLAQARAIALLAPAQAGVSVTEYAPNVVKKSVTGRRPRRQGADPRHDRDAAAGSDPRTEHAGGRARGRNRARAPFGDGAGDRGGGQMIGKLRGRIDEIGRTAR